MASKTLSTKILLRNDTAAQWVAANPVLAAGEIGVETDTRKMKIGNGSAVWNTLPYAAAGSADKLTTSRKIALSGGAAGTPTAFDGSGDVTIPVTSLDASKLTGNAPVGILQNPGNVYRGNIRNNPADVICQIATGGYISAPVNVSTLNQGLTNNKLFLQDPSLVLFEESADGGNTWTEVVNDGTKRRNLFAELSTSASPCYLQTNRENHWRVTIGCHPTKVYYMDTIFFWGGMAGDQELLSVETYKAGTDTWAALSLPASMPRTIRQAAPGWTMINLPELLYISPTNQNQSQKWRFTVKPIVEKLYYSWNNALYDLRAYGGYDSGLNMHKGPWTWNSYGDLTFPRSLYPSADNVGSIGGTGQKWAAVCATNFIENNTPLASKYALKTEIPNIPATLPNPYRLTFVGIAPTEYDGSQAVEVRIPKGDTVHTVHAQDDNVGLITLSDRDVWYIDSRISKSVTLNYSVFTKGDRAVVWAHRSLSLTWTAPSGVTVETITYANSTATSGPWDRYEVVRVSDAFVVLAKYAG